MDLFAWFVWVIETLWNVTNIKFRQFGILDIVNGGTCKAVFWYSDCTFDESIACILPLVAVVAHEKWAVWMQMNSIDVKSLALLFVEEDRELIQNVLERWFAVFSLAEIWGFIPMLDKHEQLLLVHAKRVCVSDDVFLKKIEKLTAWEISKLYMNSMVLTSFSHFLPKSGLLWQSFLCLLQGNLLKKLIPTKHMSSDVWIMILNYLMIDLKLFQLTSVWIMHEIESVWSWSFESTIENCVTFFIFEYKMEIFLLLLLFWS